MRGYFDSAASPDSEKVVLITVSASLELVPEVRPIVCPVLHFAKSNAAISRFEQLPS
jgi:hypothetical protein